MKDESIIDPMAPEKVLLGLIFVNFGPLKILPKINPPISEKMHVKRITKVKIFKCIKEVKIINKVQKQKIQTVNNVL